MTLKNVFDTAAKGDGSKASMFIDKIIAERPDLADATFYVPSRGVSAITVMTENEVFKTPNGPETMAEFYREMLILQTMEKANAPLVPRIQSISKNRDFFSINRIRGVNFANIFPNLSDDDKHILAAEYGLARAKLQQSMNKVKLPVSDAFRAKAGQESAEKALKLWDKPFMVSAVSQLPAEMGEVLNEFSARYSKRKPAFCHGDVHGDNLLVDPETLKITAFIDLARSYQSSFVEYEFDHSLNFFLFKDTSYVMTAYDAYASALSPSYSKTDLFSYEALGTLGFWLHDSEKKTPEIVKRGILNCVEDIPAKKGHYLAFAQGSAKP